MADAPTNTQTPGCPVCAHPQSSLIDMVLAKKRRKLVTLHGSYGLPMVNLKEHNEKHVLAKQKLLITRQHKNLDNTKEIGKHLLGEIALITQDVVNLQHRSEREGDIKLALGCLAERRELVKLLYTVCTSALAWKQSDPTGIDLTKLTDDQLVEVAQTELANLRKKGHPIPLVTLRDVQCTYLFAKDKTRCLRVDTRKVGEHFLCPDHDGTVAHDPETAPVAPEGGVQQRADAATVDASVVGNG